MIKNQNCLILIASALTVLVLFQMPSPAKSGEQIVVSFPRESILVSIEQNNIEKSPTFEGNERLVSRLSKEFGSIEISVRVQEIQESIQESEREDVQFSSSTIDFDFAPNTGQFDGIYKIYLRNHSRLRSCSGSALNRILFNIGHRVASFSLSETMDQIVLLERILRIAGPERCRGARQSEIESAQKSLIDRAEMLGVTVSR